MKPLLEMKGGVETMMTRLILNGLEIPQTTPKETTALATPFVAT